MFFAVFDEMADDGRFAPEERWRPFKRLNGEFPFGL
jgi:hypothetical protein